MKTFCCEGMEDNVYLVDLNASFCDGDEDTKVVYYSSKFDEYGIPVHNDENIIASSYIIIKHCPWCGKKFPESKRDEWFDALEKLGYDSPFNDRENIPPEFNTSEWYSKT